LAKRSKSNAKTAAI